MMPSMLCRLFVPVIAVSTLTTPGQAPLAGLLVGPASATVDAGSPADFWTLTQAASLTVNPGGQTLALNINNSTASLSGATVNATTQSALEVNGANGVVSVNGSTLVSTQGAGVTAVVGAVATLADSQVSAVARGLNVSSAQLSARNIQVNVTGDGGTAPLSGGAAVVQLSGAVVLSEGSRLVGANNGAVLLSDLAGTGEPGRQVSLVLDNSSLQGVAGSGINILPLRGRAPIADISLRNGATLIGGNGNAVELAAGTSATLTVDASTVTGGLSTATGAALGATLRNASTLSGNTVVGTASTLSLEVDASQLTGDIAVQDSSQAVLAFRNGARLDGSVATQTPAATDVLLDNSSMAGNLDATGAATNLTLQNGATLTGQVSGANQLALGAGSTWNMTRDSQANALSVDASRINLNGTVGAFHTLTVGSLAGSGTFVMNTDIGNLQGDRLVVSGLAEGAHSIEVASTGVEPKAGDAGLVLVNTGGGAGVFSLPSGQVDAGTFVYDLQHQGNDWALVQRTSEVPGEPEEPGGPDEPGSPEEPGSPGEPGSPEEPGSPGEPGNPEEPGTPGEPELPGEPGEPGGPIVSPSARAVLGLFSAAPTVWYGETATLRSRMGELRLGRGSSGPWVRAFGGKYDLSAGGGVAYQQRQQGISFGVDAPLPAADGQWMIGVMGGYSRSNLDLASGTDGHVDSYYAGLYSTWLGDAGYYVDALIKANRFSNDSDVSMSDGRRAGGDYDNFGVGGSLEVGKHIKLADGWFVEPYGQVSALWVQGEDYALDNGMQARSNKANSLLAKVGTHIGRSYTLADGGTLQPYLKVAAAQEFAKSNRVKVNDTYSFNNDLSGGRGELGVGVVAQLSTAVQLHGDFDYSHGKNIEQPWGVSLGVRYVW